MIAATSTLERSLQDFAQVSREILLESSSSFDDFLLAAVLDQDSAPQSRVLFALENSQKIRNKYIKYGSSYVNRFQQLETILRRFYSHNGIFQRELNELYEKLKPLKNNFPWVNSHRFTFSLNLDKFRDALVTLVETNSVEAEKEALIMAEYLVTLLERTAVISNSVEETQEILNGVQEQLIICQLNVREPSHG